MVLWKNRITPWTALCPAERGKAGLSLRAEEAVPCFGQGSSQRPSPACTPKRVRKPQIRKRTTPFLKNIVERKERLFVPDGDSHRKAVFFFQEIKIFLL